MAVDDAYISYDEAAARLGVHRSTLNDWIAQGRLHRVILDRRGYVTAASLSAVMRERPTSRRGGTVASAQDRSVRSQVAIGAKPAVDPPNPQSHVGSQLPLDLAPTVSRLVRQLQDREKAVAPCHFPLDRTQASRPGLYSWWADEQARQLLSEVLEAELSALLYVGQTGATSKRSRRRSERTLGERIGQQHIRGNARSSTFRLTISSLLAEPLGLVPPVDRKLEPVSNARVTQWIADHLRVVIAPFDDRDVLSDVEKMVLADIDPPLNLEDCPPSDVRARLSELRALIRR